ncbi:hypothetical protein AXG93_4620s2110 [Marchantia polymorpha subsp. ruderalis]|uniref:Uncharacterized protein n=1 Tax=Marchantia polymorpha subsp. ruderalis TaxID=1480154 RepID=A0A176VZN8_MARPO|nr:hypothetical protein AXG93_4620s2110 [Marchantia polymorpha subsp. ruderalis]
MELGMPGDGPGVAARESLEFERVSTAPGEMRNVAVAILQILQPHRTSYMSSWQVGFVELALAGTPIH